MIKIEISPYFEKFAKSDLSYLKFKYFILLAIHTCIRTDSRKLWRIIMFLPYLWVESESERVCIALLSEQHLSPVISLCSDIPAIIWPSSVMQAEKASHESCSVWYCLMFVHFTSSTVSVCFVQLQGSEDRSSSFLPICAQLCNPEAVRLWWCSV